MDHCKRLLVLNSPFTLSSALAVISIHCKNSASDPVPAGLGILMDPGFLNSITNTNVTLSAWLRLVPTQLVVVVCARPMRHQENELRFGGPGQFNQ